jgi:hypothetical protein
MFLSGSRDLASGSESQPDSAAADGASRGDQLGDWAIYVIGLSHSRGWVFPDRQVVGFRPLNALSK